MVLINNKYTYNNLKISSSKYLDIYKQHNTVSLHYWNLSNLPIIEYYIINNFLQ